MQTAQKARNDFLDTRHVAPRKRTVKMEGNVAYINSDFAGRVAPPVKKNKPAAAKRPSVRPAAKPVAKPAAKPALKKRRKTGLASTLLMLFVVFGAMALLVSRYAAVCSIGAQNNALENEIQAVEAKIDALRLDMELRDDLEYIRDTAQQELGMTYPEPAQRMELDMSG